MRVRASCDGAAEMRQRVEGGGDVLRAAFEAVALAEQLVQDLRSTVGLDAPKADAFLGRLRTLARENEPNWRS